MFLIHKSGSFTYLPFYLFALISILYATSVHADITGCPAGAVRKATAEDVSNFKKLNGSNIPLDTCLTQSLLDQLGLSNGGALQAQQELASFVCPGYQVGYDSSLSAATLKQTHVYFTSPNQGMDPKFLVCAAKFLTAARAQGLNPCITAALRTVAHQRASCLDRSNTVVCGRQNRCTNFSSCPHVGGIALDIKSQSGRQIELQKLASSMNLIFTLPTTDAVHMQPQSSCRGAGSPTTPTQTPGGTTPGSQQPSTTGIPRYPAPDPDTADPSTENPYYPANGICQPGYVLYNGRCLLSDSPLTCPIGSTRTVVSIDPIDVQCLPAQSQSYCQIGYVPIDNQCLPTRCDGYSPRAVYNTDPLQVIQCNQQQQQYQCPIGYTFMYNRCVPYSQNQSQYGYGSNMPGQGGMPQTGGMTQGGMPASGSSMQGGYGYGGASGAPIGSGSTGGVGSPGTGSTGGTARCTPQFVCQNGTVYFQTNICSMQIYQTCQYGCGSNNACATLSTSGTSTSATSTTFLDQLNRLLSTPATAGAPTQSVTGAILNALSGNGVPGQSTGLILNPDVVYSPYTLQGTSIQNMPGSYGYRYLPNSMIPTQTFTSDDISIMDPSYSLARMSPLQKALANIQLTLAGILNYLHLAR